MGIVDGIKSFLNIGAPASPAVQTKEVFSDPGGNQFDGSIHKAFIPNHIYKPAFGYPRSDDVLLLRQLGMNAYINSIISTIQFQVASTKWEIVPRDDLTTVVDEEVTGIYDFFENPNGNDESFNHLLRAVVKDILELDSGIWVKVFDGKGQLKQLFARDGATFLKNPDIHGYLGDRDDFIYDSFFMYNPDTGAYEKRMIERNQESDLVQLKDRAAYWQYGWTAASIPVPFGKREIMWFSAWPQTNSIYGRSPLSVLKDVLYTLLYGATFNLDFYLNNNIPDGVIQLIGANKDDIRAFRERWENQFVEKDLFGNNRKKFFKFPITNSEAKFTPFVFSSKEMEVIEQQKWFWKIVLACFGVTPSEMGFTEDTNKATEVVQSGVFKRKAIQPILDVIEYHINLQLMPELDPSRRYRFQWVQENLQDDLARAQLNQLYLQMGVKSADMIAEEMGIDLDRLHEDQQKQQEQEMQKMEAEAALFGDVGGDPSNDPKQQKDEAKSVAVKYTRRTGTSGHYRYYYNDRKRRLLQAAKDSKIRKVVNEHISNAQYEMGDWAEPISPAERATITRYMEERASSARSQSDLDDLAKEAIESVLDARDADEKGRLVAKKALSSKDEELPGLDEYFERAQQQVSSLVAALPSHPSSKKQRPLDDIR